MKIEGEQRQRLLLMITMVVVAIWVADRFVLTSLLVSWRERSQEIITMRGSIQRGADLIERARFTRERWDSMRTNALPNGVSAAEGGVLRTFDRWSQVSGLTINSIKPQWKHPEEDYMTLDCRVDASGNMAALSRFLYELEHDPIALKVESLEIGSRDAEGAQLTLALEVSGLYLNPLEQ